MTQMLWSIFSRWLPVIIHEMSLINFSHIHSIMYAKGFNTDTRELGLNRRDNLTRFFEVMNRDGAARIGRLLIKGGIETPYIERPQASDRVIVNGGSSLLHGAIAGSKDTFTAQPYIGLPYHVRSELAQVYAPAKVLEKSEYPLAVVVHPDWDVQGGDMYIMAGARSLEGDPRALLDSIIKIRGTTKSDTALYVPALATPESVAMLIYLGADVVDDVLATAKAYQGYYLTQDGEYKLSDLSDLPCSCEVCRAQTVDSLKGLPEKERFEILARHNYLKLLEEVRRVKVHIRNGVLREYVEKQCRSRPWLTALLRLADAEYSLHRAADADLPVVPDAGVLCRVTKPCRSKALRRAREDEVQERRRYPADHPVLCAQAIFNVEVSHGHYQGAG